MSQTELLLNRAVKAIPGESVANVPNPKPTTHPLVKSILDDIEDPFAKKAFTQAMAGGPVLPTAPAVQAPAMPAPTMMPSQSGGTPGIGAATRSMVPGAGAANLAQPQDNRAAALPGTPGHAATNVIDQRGPLDPQGLTVDGNNAAGIKKLASCPNEASTAVPDAEGVGKKIRRVLGLHPGLTVGQRSGSETGKRAFCRSIRERVKVASPQPDAEAAEEPAANPPQSKEILDMQHPQAEVADLMLPGLWGGERAGRAQTLATASGQKTPFSVQHPLTQSTLWSLGGNLAGALTGAAIGATLDSKQPGRGAGNGAFYGGLAGLAGGGVLSGVIRRAKMRQIAKNYDEARQAGNVQKVQPQFSALEGLLAPLRGAHRTGQLAAAKQIAGQPDDSSALRHGLYAASAVPYLGAPVRLLHGWGQNARTQLAQPVSG